MNGFTLISLVSISPSEASSWCLSTYLWHFDRAFSLGVDTLIALGTIGCMTVSRSKLEAGLWSTHFSPPAECERLCIGWTGGGRWWFPVWERQRKLFSCDKGRDQFKVAWVALKVEVSVLWFWKFGCYWKFWGWLSKYCCSPTVHSSYIGHKINIWSSSNT